MKVGGMAGALGAFPAKRSAGFTIVEVLIVLAVSGALMVSAVALINGRQNKTEFQTGINNVQQQIQQIINETTSGYYPNVANFTCIGNANGGVVKFAAGSTNQGANDGCIFLGKAIQFGLGTSGDDPSTLGVLPLVGNQYYTPPLATAPQPILTLAQAVPRALYPATAETSGAPPSNVVTKALMDYGLTFAASNGQCTSSSQKGMCFKKNLTDTNTYQTGMVGIVSGDSSGNITARNVAGSGLESGAQQFSPYAVSPSGGTSSVDDSLATASANIGNWSSAAGTGGLVPAAAIYICVASATTNQSGLFTVQSGSLNVKLDIKGNQTCSNG